MSARISSLNATMAGTLDGVSAVSLAIYLGMVVYRGNVKSLGSSVLADAPGFLEFVVSLYLVSLIVSIHGPVGDIATAIVILAIVGIIAKSATRGGLAPLQDYSAGKIGLFETVKRLLTK